jgi:hypothetical protein
MANGQVGHDVVELAPERGKCGEGPVDALGQNAEGTRITRGKPEYVVAEPARIVQPEAESGDGRE